MRKTFSTASFALVCLAGPLLLIGCRPAATTNPTSAASAVSQESAIEATSDREGNEKTSQPTEVIVPPDAADVLPTSMDDLQSAREHQQLREALDRTVWSDEVDAQRHEEIFIQLWDDLRYRFDPFEILKAFPVETLHLHWPGEPVEHALGIQQYRLDQSPRTFDQSQWHAFLDQLQDEGYQVVQTEWHHAKFRRLGPEASHSTVTMAIDLVRDKPQQRFTVRGTIEVRWRDQPGQPPHPQEISTVDVEILQRDGAVAFREILSAETDSIHRRLLPLIVYDLDRDGQNDILVGGLNRIYFNQGQGRFREEPVWERGLDIFDAALVADFTGDGFADLICVGPDRHPQILAGKADGRFTEPRRCAEYYLEFPKSFTAGDIDGDGDLDLWIGQYKFPYVQGSMPTPFYDANDGYPAVLLRNDGQGQFTDVTEQAGLTAKRHRRTYSSSLVDLDDDADLDLLVVSDFSGIDLYENDGQGHFTDVTDRWASERHHFGMAHSLADYDLDGQLDFYVIGMSSTTARRLDAMNLGREDHPQINQMRAAMGYGNRMYLSRDLPEGRGFVQPDFASQVARTGWSWGTTSFDFDNDGDRDIYVANGHTSGKSAKDYCTRYWCHDVYTGSSQPNDELARVFGHSLQDLHQGEISWNGFEHNVLLMNQGGQGFLSMAFLLGLAYEFDSRGVVGDDLDGDGRPDLLVVEFRSKPGGQAQYKLHVLRNELETPHHWIGVRLSEQAGGPSPIGAQVILQTQRGRQIARLVTGDSFSSQHPPVVHFGLADQDQVEALQVQWLDGTTRTLPRPAVNTYHAVSAEKELRPLFEER